MLTSDHGCTSLIVPLILHPLRNNTVICYDLRYDPESLINLSTEAIEELLFISRDDPQYEERIRLKGIQFNKCPILAPASVLDDESYSRLHISREICQKHYEKLIKAQKEIADKLSIIYAKEPEHDIQSSDPDTQIYTGGFFSDNDRDQFVRLHKVKPDDISTLTLQTKDPRVPDMLFRWKGRNYPDTLSAAEKESWQNFCNQRHLQVLASRQQTLDDYEQQLSLHPQFKMPSKL